MPIFDKTFKETAIFLEFIIMQFDYRTNLQIHISVKIVEHHRLSRSSYLCKLFIGFQ